jgi:energy-converting hydrogenase Eha subunit F
MSPEVFVVRLFILCLIIMTVLGILCTINKHLDYKYELNKKELQIKQMQIELQIKSKEM